jgi:rifampicin phosphotransferase
LTEPKLVVDLAEAAELGPKQVGSKATNLARLARAGFRVPPALVITTDAYDRWPELKERLSAKLGHLGGMRFAVRSSAVAEDLGGASYAGQYESYLNVASDGLEETIKRCWESASAERVAAYEKSRSESTGERHAGMAVIVQRLVRSDAAGVAFTANPVTGNRHEIVVTAVRGFGERLVSGEAVGDEWVAGNGGGVRATRTPERAIAPQQAAAVAELARQVASLYGEPMDIEWAFEGNQLYLLQARPMTALPEAVDWTPPASGYWMRNFRIGEWLHDPMTPLFRTWVLELLEGGYSNAERQMAGTAVPFPHAAINGWYYTALPRFGPLLLMRALSESRLRLVPFLLNVLIRVSSQPQVADRAVLRGLYEDWRDRLLPEYRELIAMSEARLDTAADHELVTTIDQLGKKAGRYLAYLAVVGGSAWKMEGCLAKFFRQHLAATVDGSVQVLLRGLPGTAPVVPAHAVQSLDWFWPTAGEMGWARESTVPATHQRLASEREQMEANCRAALAERPNLLARFGILLEVCQRYAVIREEQARDFTLAWPLLRQCALRIGRSLCAHGRLEQADDIFFLTRVEVESPSGGQELVARRRAEWEQQRRLVAPLTIGTAPRALVQAVEGAVDAARTSAEIPEGAIVGEPASPGRASGPVRIVRGPADFDGFQPGDVLVAEATAPAWTPLFARAAAVVTDGGTLAAHASLVAREFGIPAVVGTGDATVRLNNGQMVVVDGSAGMVVRL